MPARLKCVDPNRPLRFSRAYAAFARTRVARWISIHLMWKLDPHVMRLTGGRFGMGLVLPTAVLETRGAKTGAVRRNVVIYFHDGDRVTIVASHLGLDRHPGWFHNLCANPDVTFGGFAMRAEAISDDAERTRLWALADTLFPPYAMYRDQAAQADRTIPIVQLTRKDP